MPHFKLEAQGAGLPERLDRYLARHFEKNLSRSLIQRTIQAGSIFINEKKAKSSTLVFAGDWISGLLDAPKPFAFSEVTSENFSIPILYEDESLVVVNKPAGLVVHPGAGRRQGTLVQVLLKQGIRLSEQGSQEGRPGIVHRLDKDTSGILLVAKTDAALRDLQEQFALHTVQKKYLALVHGRVEFEEGRLERAIGRDPKIRFKMAVKTRMPAKPAETRYRVLERFRAKTLLEVALLTGRTHQIRVHMADLGHPVVGDALYGRADQMPRQALHAWKIEFCHPANGKLMRFECAIPDDMKRMIDEAK